MGVENANTRTVHKFLKNLSNDTEVTQQKFTTRYSRWNVYPPLRFSVSKANHAMERTNRSKLLFRYTA